MKNSNLSSIEFIILSHPHYDHYSGIYDLLKHCRENNIKIINFVHTLDHHPDFMDLESFLSNVALTSYSKVQFTKLQSVLEFADDLFNQGIIINPPDEINHNCIPLNKYFQMKCLSPTLLEQKLFIHKCQSTPREDRKAFSKIANYLSTFIQIYTEKFYFIISSDVTYDVLENIQVRDNQYFDGKTLLLMQVPHHGSISNLNKSFVDFLYYQNGCPAIISAGYNLRYNLPDYEVVKYYDENMFLVDCTNKVNGFYEYFSI